MKGLKYKRVLITGGAGGIGTATASRFLEEGANVIIMDQDQEACQRVEQQLPALVKSFTRRVRCSRRGCCVMSDPRPRSTAIPSEETDCQPKPDKSTECHGEQGGGVAASARQSPTDLPLNWREP